MSPPSNRSLELHDDNELPPESGTKAAATVYAIYFDIVPPCPACTFKAMTFYSDDFQTALATVTEATPSNNGRTYRVTVPSAAAGFKTATATWLNGATLETQNYRYDTASGHLKLVS